LAGVTDAVLVRFADQIINEIRSREVGGLIPLPEQFKTGDRVRILRGPFVDHLAIFHDTKPRARVEILLMLLGSEQRTVLPRADIEPVPQ